MSGAEEVLTVTKTRFEESFLPPFLSSALRAHFLFLLETNNNQGSS
jgi:hypothetical protein